MINGLQYAENATANKNRLITISQRSLRNGNFDRAIDQVKDAIHRDLCGWESLCHYPDAQRQSCVHFVAQDSAKIFVANSSAPCQVETVKPKSIDCKEPDCHDGCDKQWPWARPLENCTNFCGTSNAKRN